MAKKHFMIDIETLATTPNAIVTEIGIVWFDIKTGDVIDTFHRFLNVEEQRNRGRALDMKTMAWRLENTPIESIVNSLYKNEDIADVEHWLGRFFDSEVQDTVVWCKGGSFDFPIIHSLFPESKNWWLFRNEYCCRALFAAIPPPAPSESYIKHDALHDAIFQAEHLSFICEHLKLEYE